MSFMDKAKDVAGDLADKAGDLADEGRRQDPRLRQGRRPATSPSKAGDLVEKVVDKIPDSVKDMAGDLADKAGDLVDKAKEKLGIGDDDDAPSTSATRHALRRAGRRTPRGGYTRRRRDADDLSRRRASARPRRPDPATGSSAPSASSGRPGQRTAPGVALRRAMSPCIGVPPTSVIAPRAHDVRVGGDVGHVHHRADRGVCGGELGHRLRRRPRRAPRAHDPFELVASGGATLERHEARVVADAEHDHHAPGDAVAARRHGDPAPVGAAVRAPRHGVRQAGAEPRLQPCPAARTPTAAGPSGGASSPAG